MTVDTKPIAPDEVRLHRGHFTKAGKRVHEMYVEFPDGTMQTLAIVQCACSKDDQLPE